MKTAARLTGALLLLATFAFPAQAVFTSMFVIGDSVSTTTNNPGAGPLYYGQRYSNGRVWVEVLAQRQGLAFYPSNNNSYFGNTSSNLAATINNFSAPTGLSNILFVIWVNDADLFYQAQNSGNNLKAWTNAINISLTNHFKAITNLYAKGARTLIMPNVVDLSTIPQYDRSPYTNVIHQMCTNYNVLFSAVLNRAKTNCPGLTIYSPDFFTFVTNLLAHPASHGVTNALYNGQSVDAVEDPALTNKALSGPGTNYIFWDPTDPTAMVHAWLANLTQQLISPAQVGQITSVNGSNRLDLVNVPVGQNGLVLVSSSLVSGSWMTNTTFLSTNATQSVLVPDSGPWQFYRLSFPYSWTWP